MRNFASSRIPSTSPVSWEVQRNDSWKNTFSSLSSYAKATRIITSYKSACNRKLAIALLLQECFKEEKKQERKRIGSPKNVNDLESPKPRASPLCFLFFILEPFYLFFFVFSFRNWHVRWKYFLGYDGCFLLVQWQSRKIK